MLILNSGEWVLGEELAASPWRVLIYRQRGEPRNELHLWLPGAGRRGPAELAFRRYWVCRATRWCLEIPDGPARDARPPSAAAVRLRFTSPEGRVLWAEGVGPRGLGDLSEGDLLRLLGSAREAPAPGP